MNILHSIIDVRKRILSERQLGKKISLVPTMGYLHQGHLSLIKIARENSNFVCSSIYVNPKQFAPNEDLDKYPRNLERDLNLLKENGCDLVFVPSDQEMYSSNSSTAVVVEKYSSILEGAIRNTHFQGVTTVVSKLFNIFQPDVAVFGQKDAQQLFIIRKMVEDLNYHVEIIEGPIVRETDGLAMSSRNVYLTKRQRRGATILFRTLSYVKELYLSGESDSKLLVQKGKDFFTQVEFASLDYLEIVEKNTFNKADLLKKEETYIALIAGRIGETRLIDNIYLN